MATVLLIACPIALKTISLPCFSYTKNHPHNYTSNGRKIPDKIQTTYHRQENNMAVFGSWICGGKNKARKDDEVEFLTFPFPLKNPSKTCTDFKVTLEQLYMYTRYSIL